MAMIGRSAVRQRMNEDDPGAAEALGPRGANEVLAQHLDDAGAHHARSTSRRRAGPGPPTGSTRWRERAVAAQWNQPSQLLKT